MKSIHGFKTYALAIVGVLYAITGAILGHLGVDEAIQISLAALSAATLRHGITNS